jgi:uncharacterized protein (TIGR03437 family)
MVRPDSVSIRHSLCVISLGLTLSAALPGAALTLQVSSVSGTQVNAIVPYEVSGKAMTTIQVVNNGIPSAAWAIPAAAATPGIFTQDETGQGLAAVLNQDNSVNGPSSPVAR